ncbi:hypothetical protein [Mycolicibacterium sp. YH-1]|jgi:hypothetical protein|uniref:hypothetical protein n=1 Tax=Mycolicibacterium sp. YH-1 TaxID=2908837 RepID=UPI001F4BD941|nr:hypothetical protein [Mycolicibacterium sp. YH-1]UNB52791.1 hypothetical protein L0M16_34025 [Mycolicibacterium sp. YH-1]HET7739506.1 hypothetical protein [Mycobacterium sp.]
MKNIGFASVIAGGLAAAVLGLAAPAQADTASAVPAANVAAVLQTAPTGIDHHGWLYDIQPRAHAPQVDTTVHQSR